MRGFGILLAMTTLVKDTHALIGYLQQKGYSKEQAEGFVDAVKGFSVDELATKADIAEVKHEILKAKNDTLKMNVAQGIAVVGMTVGLIQLLG